MRGGHVEVAKGKVTRGSSLLKSNSFPLQFWGFVRQGGHARYLVHTVSMGAGGGRATVRCSVSPHPPEFLLFV